MPRLYNDVNNVVAKNYSGLVDFDDGQTMVDPNASVPCIRSRACWKEKRFSISTIFTRAVLSWIRSNQNDSEGSDF